jgi:hypothetical protein
MAEGDKSAIKLYGLHFAKLSFLPCFLFVILINTGKELLNFFGSSHEFHF